MKRYIRASKDDNFHIVLFSVGRSAEVVADIIRSEYPDCVFTMGYDSCDIKGPYNHRKAIFDILDSHFSYEDGDYIIKS